MTNEAGQWEITVDARQSSLGKVAEFIGDVCDALTLNEDTAFDVQLATDEACQNAVEHACEYSPDEQVQVSCKLVGADLEITVSDRGHAFDPSDVSPPDLTSRLEERAEGGLGLFLMRQVMDDVRFERSPDGVNTVVMIKKGASSPARSATEQDGGGLPNPAPS
jgi:anti-sigma regulatory factor (Ser/Thr protein kinase)